MVGVSTQQPQSPVRYKQPDRTSVTQHMIAGKVIKTADSPAGHQANMPYDGYETLSPSCISCWLAPELRFTATALTVHTHPLTINPHQLHTLLLIIG